jgi:hypothetical protein
MPLERQVRLSSVKSPSDKNREPIAMTTRELAKAEWNAYFDQFSKHLIGEKVIVEIQGLEFVGDRHQARCLPLIGLTYDSKDNILQVAMDGLDHLIHEPREIIVTDGPDGLESLKVVDANRQTQIVTLVKPLRYRRRK